MSEDKTEQDDLIYISMSDGGPGAVNEALNRVSSLMNGMPDDARFDLRLDIKEADGDE